VLAAVCALVAVAFAVRGRWRDGVVLFVVAGGGAALNAIMKAAFERPRPELWPRLPDQGFSFPSGHAMETTIVFGYFAYLIAREAPRRAGAAYLSAAVGIVLIALSRLYLGVHWPSDVIGGIAMGYLWVWACVVLVPVLTRRRALSAAFAIAACAALVAHPAIAQERNAAGDIPDNQAFVTYQGAGYRIDVPEGWARTQQGRTVRFTEKTNAIEIVTQPAEPPSGTPVKLRHATATRRAFRAQGPADPVTGKRFTLENERYYFRNGKTVVRLTLSAPAGADNVDQWRRIADSFTWR
jgi:PAP2 superfamily protein